MPKPKNVSRAELARHPRLNVAMAVDWQGNDDNELTLLFAGAEFETVREVCKCLLGTAARVIRIERQTPPKYRNGYVDERVACILKEPVGVFSTESILLVIKRRLESIVNPWHIDCYELDDFINLSKREPEKIFEPKPVSSDRKKKKRSGRKKQEQPPKPKTNETASDMANIYLRVPWYVASYYRGREEDNQLTEWQPVEFADYSHEYNILENNLRLIPEQVQSHICYSQRAWNNIVHGRLPDGGDVIIKRNPDVWPDARDVCTLIGMAYQGKQSGADYLCIKMPREVYYNKHVHRTTPDYCLSYEVAVYMSAMLTRKFCYEYMEWTEYRREFLRRQGLKAKAIDTVEMFFVQYNFPVAIRPTERESLRRMHTRWLANAKKHPAYHYNFEDRGFLEHISDDDRRRAEDRAKRFV